jgi:1,4-alpha-glucan branching enzyme
MGTELAPWREWDHESSLDWHLEHDPLHRAFGRFVQDLGQLYRESPCLWRGDPEPAGFEWIDTWDWQQSIVCYARHDAGDHRIVVLNLTPVPRDDYRIGALRPGAYTQQLSSDDARYGGSQYPTVARASTEPVPCHGRPQSLRLRVPPLGALILAPSD